MAQSHKAEALEAIREAKRLAQKDTLTVLERVQLAALLDFLMLKLDQIQELKKQRRTPPAAPAQGSLNTT